MSRKKVLLLHAYSATNFGDGMLVDESIRIINSVLGDCDVTILALHPSTFSGRPEKILDASWFRPRTNKNSLGDFKNLKSYDVIFGVGGGYLRFGRLSESIKTFLAHGLQLTIASFSRTPTVYLPQSIGPFRYGTRYITRFLLARIDLILARDDRTIEQLGLPNLVRVPDLAIISSNWQRRDALTVCPAPVLSVRFIHGQLPGGVKELASQLSIFDGYVQSTGAGNDDQLAMDSIYPQQKLSRETLLSGSERRVIVAVRLHAALMALQAGHWVIHLAYERKGFGAFKDLGLEDFVFNVNDFDPTKVKNLTMSLLTDESQRLEYDQRITRARDEIPDRTHAIVDEIRHTIELRG